jgi:hypothetical protein
MTFEIHIYLGTACITEKSSYKYPVGEKHAFLFYLKEDENSEYNQFKAEEIITNLGFNEIEFSKVGRLSPDKVGVGDKKKHFNNAVKSGSTLVLYRDPI